VAIGVLAALGFKTGGQEIRRKEQGFPLCLLSSCSTKQREYSPVTAASTLGDSIDSLALEAGSHEDGSKRPPSNRPSRA
jgi:hypothetical protein